MSVPPASLQSFLINGSAYAVSDPALTNAFQGFFGPRVEPADFTRAFEAEGMGLRLTSLSIEGRPEAAFTTEAVFSGDGNALSGTCRYVWSRREDGTLCREKEASLQISGSHDHLALQIHGNLLEFARQSQMVSDFLIEARAVGRYAYRFMDGVEIEVGTRARIGERLKAFAKTYRLDWNQDAFEKLKSPREIADFFVLPRFHAHWMDIVDGIVDRRGYRFTVDQMVDVARRPGLVFLIDEDSYTMTLNLQDERAVTRFRASILEGRQGRALQRLRGVLGSSYAELPRDVRNALILYRPYLYARPRQTPPLPDFSSYEMPQSPQRVVGFRSKDGVLLRALQADPPQASLRDYRNPEVREIVARIQEGVEVVSATGLSGSGKTEVLIWNLERALSQLGHRVVSLENILFLGSGRAWDLLPQIDEAVQPTVLIFDESVYISGDWAAFLTEFLTRFLGRPGQHVVFVGGGTTSPERQRKQIEEHLEILWSRFRTAHVSLWPKPVNAQQMYRFLGLARIDWADESSKVGLLTYILERYPPYFIPVLPIRLHEHPEVGNVAQARALIDAECVPDYWSQVAMMVFEKTP